MSSNIFLPSNTKVIAFTEEMIQEEVRGWEEAYIEAHICEPSGLYDWAMKNLPNSTDLAVPTEVAQWFVNLYNLIHAVYTDEDDRQAELSRLCMNTYGAMLMADAGTQPVKLDEFETHDREIKEMVHKIRNTFS